LRCNGERIDKLGRGGYLAECCGLVFELLDRAYLTRMRRERGFGVNPLPALGARGTARDVVEMSAPWGAEFSNATEEEDLPGD
jgi:hypothetical protein